MLDAVLKTGNVDFDFDSLSELAACGFNRTFCSLEAVVDHNRVVFVDLVAYFDHRLKEADPAAEREARIFCFVTVDASAVRFELCARAAVNVLHDDVVELDSVYEERVEAHSNAVCVGEVEDLNAGNGVLFALFNVAHNNDLVVVESEGFNGPVGAGFGGQSRVALVALYYREESALESLAESEALLAVEREQIGGQLHLENDVVARGVESLLHNEVGNVRAGSAVVVKKQRRPVVLENLHAVGLKNEGQEQTRFVVGNVAGVDVELVGIAFGEGFLRGHNANVEARVEKLVRRRVDVHRRARLKRGIRPRLNVVGLHFHLGDVLVLGNDTVYYMADLRKAVDREKREYHRCGYR